MSHNGMRSLQLCADALTIDETLNHGAKKDMTCNGIARVTLYLYSLIFHGHRFACVFPESEASSYHLVVLDASAGALHSGICLRSCVPQTQ